MVEATLFPTEQDVQITISPADKKVGVMLSVVATLYRSEPYIDEFLARVRNAAMQFAGDDYEIILVNDGSPDESLAKAIAHCRVDKHLRIIDLSRNFGHHKAIMAGLAEACGCNVFLIDSDLEEPPECLASLAAALKNRDCDVAFGVQPERKGGAIERIGGQMFWSLINMMTSTEMTANPLTARMMTRRYVDALLLHQEQELFLAGLFHITGFTQIAVTVTKSYKGATSYRLSDRFRLLVNAVTSFSNVPLIGIFYCGLVIFLVSLLYAAFLIFQRSVFNTIVEGWTSVIVSVWLLGGLMISFIGIIGIYLSKIFSEVKRRPRAIIRRIYDHGSR